MEKDEGNQRGKKGLWGLATGLGSCSFSASGSCREYSARHLATRTGPPKIAVHQQRGFFSQDGLKLGARAGQGRRKLVNPKIPQWSLWVHIFFMRPGVGV